MKAIFRTVAATLLLFLSIGAHAAKAQQLVMEEFMVPAVDPGISLYVRKQTPAADEGVSGREDSAFRAWCDLPAETSFDLKLNGLSWMSS